MKSRRAFEILPYTKASRPHKAGLLCFIFGTVTLALPLQNASLVHPQIPNPGHLFHRYITGSVTDKKYFASSSGDWLISFLIHHCTIPTKLPAI